MELKLSEEYLYIRDGGDPEYGRDIAERLGLEPVASECPTEGLFLILDGDGLSLSDGAKTVRGDFTRMLMRLRPRNLGGELLVRASKLKDPPMSPKAFDATAGLGEDSLLLSAAGFHVTMYEHDPVIAALLSDALKRAGNIPELSEIVSRMQAVTGDSIAVMSALDSPPDIIYLDPMFPERQKSALVKKKFQLIHGLEAPCENERELLMAAIHASPRRIVIKRPLKGEYLGGVKPSYSISGKAVRYDCIVPTQKNE